MNISFHDTPSPYAVVTDIFDTRDLQTFQQIASQAPMGDSWIENKDMDQYAWKLYHQIYPTLDRKTQDRNNCLECSTDASFFRIQIKKLEPGFKRNRIHTDSDWKQFVTVVYLDGQGLGTKLYDSNEGDPVQVIPYVHNTGYSMIPNATSWHDFDHSADFTETRTTLMFILANRGFYK